MKEERKRSLDRRDFLKVAVAGAATAVSGTVTGGATTPESIAGNELAWMPGWQLTGRIARKELSPVEVVASFLRRIDRLDPLIHAYITVDYEGALEQARNAEKAIMSGARLGPLHGLPVSIKDLYDTRGLRTTQGSAAFADTVPDRDEILVERLRRAGAIIIGKTHTPEFATFPRTKTFLAGECRNPWNLNRITGASSGGSGAAVAAGMTAFSIGSDGGGSTRIPACFNGVFGFHPSAGRIPMRAPRSVQMASAGPMTLHVRDAANLIQVMSGSDPRDPSAIECASPSFLEDLDKGVEGYKIAWSPDLGRIPIVDRRVVDKIEAGTKRFAEAGAHVDSPDLYFPDEAAWEVFMVLNETSMHRGSRLLELTRAQQAKLTPPTRAMLERVRTSPLPGAEDEVRALEKRAEVQAWVDAIFARYDLICTPVLGLTAPPVPDGEWQQPYSDPYYAGHISTCYTYFANILGLPAASVPCGFVDGLPAGMQIVGPRFADTRVMRAAQSFARIQPWMEKHPEI
jgi:Asp-tRNA(Asn)/Glu-tRNA(Gln) amidotransferase A subunit family amidase